MPEPFGTHHSKMMILLRHDDLAQVIIHTANMIHMDWTNMTQAAWRSPLLPLQKTSSAGSQTDTKIGSGARFKRDLLTYLKAYGPKKTGPLVQQLDSYDFGSIRAALIASVPSKKHVSDSSSEEDTLWGWPALKDLMSQIPIQQKNTGKKPHIVIQISSVATLGQTKKWLKDVFFKALTPTQTPKPTTYSIIFPTPDEIRRSLDGYNSGGSIHMKTQSATQQKQLQYMRPHLCQWAGDTLAPGQCVDLSEDNPPTREAGRARAAPHIKTYIRFGDSDMKTIDWAMVSSANLSTQAWGAATNASGEVRICSWEIGVVIWPDLFRDGGCGDAASASESRAEEKSPMPDTLMVPCFRRDCPSVSEGAETASVVVGFRMPYDLPLTPYGAGDEPWCATASHALPDWRGESWIA
ncbi:Tyrosyl-DNA phosphodiesterase [Penicillium roqueforti FM164]|uniref:Tyrosyl-DNA phosphodiesterase n=1 Tax=Penicillium roqueforti (strain FM164) TaxID=1365484 RepID=W6PUE9_PENRF|nr:Tyrosyl-DNA phosphodiesterase [Penicillium roqueforti FM164]